VRGAREGRWWQVSRKAEGTQVWSRAPRTGLGPAGERDGVDRRCRQEELESAGCQSAWRSRSRRTDCGVATCDLSARGQWWMVEAVSSGARSATANTMRYSNGTAAPGAAGCDTGTARRLLMLVRTSRRRHANRAAPKSRTRAWLPSRCEGAASVSSRPCRCDRDGSQHRTEAGCREQHWGAYSLGCLSPRDRKRGLEETGSEDERKSHRSRALVPNQLREDTRDTRCSSHSMQAGDRNG
jgi:hypothetical protein